MATWNLFVKWSTHSDDVSKLREFIGYVIKALQAQSRNSPKAKWYLVFFLTPHVLHENDRVFIFYFRSAEVDNRLDLFLFCLIQS